MRLYFARVLPNKSPVAWGSQCKKMHWTPKFFAATPNTSHVGGFWPFWLLEIFLRQQPCFVLRLNYNVPKVNSRFKFILCKNCNYQSNDM